MGIFFKGRVLSGPKIFGGGGGGGGGGGNRGGRAGVIIVKQELCVFNCLINFMNFIKFLWGNRNSCEGNTPCAPERYTVTCINMSVHVMCM